MADNQRATLFGLKPGESGYVYAIQQGGSNIKRRLTDMGITPGTKITINKIAPMGDPVEIALRGYSLSLRGEDAKKILLMSEEEVKSKQSEQKQEFSSHLEDESAHSWAAELTKTLMFKSYSESGVSGIKDEKPMRFALVGNPNSGKTTLFNEMTGAREYVGNWPGVTVEKKEGRIKNRAASRGEDGFDTHGHDMTLIDLPGIYSLHPNSSEEIIARDFILRQKPDAVINIVDGTNLERNLYLTVQLMELECPMIIALNMMDEVEKAGDKIDCAALSGELGIPVVPISAKTGEGVTKLVTEAQSLINAVHIQTHHGFKIEPDHLYDDYTHAMHHKIDELIGEFCEKAGLPSHWCAIKLLEGDALVEKSLDLSEDAARSVRALVTEYADKSPFGDNETRVADARYSYIEQVTKKSLVRAKISLISERTRKIDRLMTNKYLAIPLFVLIMITIFALTFSTIGAFLSDALAEFIGGTLTPYIKTALIEAGTGGWFVDLICDGILAGVGGVLVFLPQIAILFFCLSLLEDSGYMARIAFIMDKPMRYFGLSGKSFIPLLMGFGCTVPAAMGARTMENEKDKRMTIMLLPFMSCSAKLPVYGLLAGAFFAKGRLIVIFSLYALGVVMGILSGLVFKKVLFKGEDAPFVIELPQYRIPTVKNTMIHVWERVWHFMSKAGTIIFAMSVLLWFLGAYTFGFARAENLDQSILGTVGRFIMPVFTPLGFGAWQAAVALITGLAAKEAVVSTLSMFYGFSLGAGATVVQSALSGTFSPLSAYSFLAFILLYPPCIAAITTMRRELGSRKWTALAVGYQVFSAYIVAMLIYQIGSLF